MITNRMNSTWEQSELFRSNYYKLLKWVLIDVIIMLLLVTAIIYMVLSYKPPTYYASTLGGEVYPLVPH